MKSVTVTFMCVLVIAFFSLAQAEQDNFPIKKKITSEEVYRRINILKHSIENGDFSIDIIEDLENLPSRNTTVTMQIFMRRLKSSLLHHIEDGFIFERDAILTTQTSQDPDSQQLQPLFDAIEKPYRELTDTIINWNISDNCLSRLNELKDKIVQDLITPIDCMQQFAVILLDELVADEKEFKNGNLEYFFSNYELIK